MITRLCTLIFYIFILLVTFDFQGSLLWDAKGVCLVVSGTLLLSLSSVRRGDRLRGLLRNAGRQAMPAAFLTTFVELFARFSTQLLHPDEVLLTVALCCRPMLYGYLLHLFLQPDKDTGTSLPAPAVPPAPPAVSLPSGTASAPCCEKKEALAGGNLQEILRGAGLSPREVEISLLVRAGLSNKEIAAQLFISDTTVKKHISNIFEKLHLTNREQLKHISFTEFTKN